MDIRADAQVISTLWEALNKPWPLNPIKPSMVNWFRDVASRGWAEPIDMEDLPSAMDGRIDPLHVLSIKTLAELFDLPMPWVYPHQSKASEEVLAVRCLSAADFAHLLIWLERLGFRMELQALAGLLQPSLKTKAHVTESERTVRFYEQWRHRMAPVSIYNNTPPPAGDLKIEKLTTPLGYRAELYSVRSGVPLSLTVSAPSARRRAAMVASEADESPGSYAR